MVRYYSVYGSDKKEEALKIARQLSTNLKQEGYPSETKVDVTYIGRDKQPFYGVLSTATPKQIEMFSEWVRRHDIKHISHPESIPFTGYREAYTERRILNLNKRYVKSQKEELAKRKKYMAELDVRKIKTKDSSYNPTYCNPESYRRDRRGKKK